MADNSHLPRFLTTFVGREDDLRGLDDALRAHRLVTLVGPGGVGKTRLAVEAARAAEARFVDGAWFVDLTAVRDGAALPAAIRAALGSGEGHGPPLQGLIELVGDRSLLLALDNCEQVIEAVAAGVEQILQSCVNLSVLATSREPLGVPGELVWRVAPLSIPQDSASATALADTPAVRLFVDRAKLANPAFALTDSNAASVVRILAAVDGLPLATELAAARVRALPVEQVAERLGERLPMLAGGARTAPERQRTMEAAVRWSHELLPEPEKVLFRRLAVFSGGWTLEAAEGVCAFGTLAEEEVLGLLEGLVDRSLVVAVPEDGRFRMLEVILEFARRELLKSDEADEVGSRHCRWYARLAATAEPHLMGPGQRFWSQRLSSDEDNIRAAVDWAAQHPADLAAGLEIAGSLHRFWMQTANTDDALAWARRLLEAPGPVPAATRARALAAAVWFAGSDWAVGQSYGAEALELAREIDDDLLLGRAFDAVARGWLGQLRLVEIRQAATEGLRYAERSGDWIVEVGCLVHLALADEEEEDLGAAAPRLERALSISRREGSLSLQALVFTCLGDHRRLMSDRETAEAYYCKGLDAAVAGGNTRLGLMNMFNRGMTLVLAGRDQLAAELLRDVLERAMHLGDHFIVADGTRGIAAIEANEGDAALAARLLGAADAWDNGESTQAPERPVVELAFSRAREKLGSSFEREYHAGRDWSLTVAARTVLATRPSAATPRPSAVPAGLSARETEILRLVARGESNQAIAEQLVLSRRTVENHVANVYSKIGAANRVEATRFAIEHGLAPAGSA